MKTQIGRAVAKPNDEYDIIDVPLIGEEDRTRPNHIPRSILVGIIRPRIEETFELVRSRLEASGVDKLAGGRAVLVGGGCQLDGVPEVASAILNKKVRTGGPLRLAGLADSTGGPAVSAAAGLLAFALNNHAAGQAQQQPMETPSSRIGRIGSWIRENFLGNMLCGERQSPQAIDKKQESRWRQRVRPKKWVQPLLRADYPLVCVEKPYDNQPQPPPKGVRD